MRGLERGRPARQRWTTGGLLALLLALGACSEDPTDKGASGGAVTSDGGGVGDGAAVSDGALGDGVLGDAGATDSLAADSLAADVALSDTSEVDDTAAPVDVVADTSAPDGAALDGGVGDGAGGDAAPNDGQLGDGQLGDGQLGDGQLGDGPVADANQLACTAHSDCSQPSTLCTKAACVDGACALVAVDEGLSCAPASPCVTQAVCQAGKCQAQALKDCDDGNTCTTDSCFAATGLCLHSPTKSGFTCDDGNACTQGATCFQGACVAQGKLDCSDSDPCTQDACDPKTGKCLHPPVKAGDPCDDGNSCTKGETCDAKGTCGAGNNTCKCSTSADCKAQEDGDLCNGTLYCDSQTGSCLVNPASLVVCEDVGTGPCQANLCDPKSGKCAVANKPGGSACDDGNPCTTPDECHKGLCQGLGNTCACVSDFDCGAFQTQDLCAGKLVCDKSGAKPVCVVDYSTQVVCTSDADTGCSKNTCDPSTGGCKMVAAANAAKCSDGQPCTVGDACLAGKCKPGPDTCACTQDSDCAKLDDGDSCNGGLFCNLGTGKCDVDPATVVVCPKAQDTVCAAAACQPATGKCELLPRNDGVKCDDGNTCTPDEVCTKGACAAKTNTCACSVDSDCAKLEDGDACNGTLYCNLAKKECQLNPTTVVTCQTVDDGFCQVNTCIPQTGKCQLVPRNDGKACDADGSACTTPDVCNGGACTPGPNTCECQQDQDCAKFEADDLCSTLVCDLLSNQCKPNPASAVYCSKIDDTVCATNTCQPKTGKCAVTPRNQGVGCDADGTSCTQGDACEGGACKAGVNTCQCINDKDCAPLEDGNPCNGTLVCGSTKTCQVDPSTVVTCQAGGGSTNPTGDAVCTKNQCDPKSGKCAALPANFGAACGNGTLCFAAPACDAGGKCAQGKPVSCDDGNPCTQDSCDPKGGTTGTGCSHGPTTGASCDDGSVCTVKDLCVKGVCTGETKVCDGGTACTNASCHPLKGCAYEARKGPCSDGDKCTTSGVCLGVKCVGVPVVCADGNPCTTDTCKSDKGCVFTHNSAPCSDGNLCTKKDTCSGGGCVGLPLQVTVDCDDGTTCTVDSCDSKVGCTHQPVSGPCADSDPCKTGDVCAAGTCKPGSVTHCDDGNHCTKDVCDGKTGACTHTADAGSKCSDGDPCTVADTCDAKAVCVAGKANTCDDGKPCTIDSCDSAANEVCQHKPTSGGQCDDGNVCTASDVCVKGACTGTKKPCPEGTACTVDSCHPTQGCTYTTIVGSCDDGDQCTTGDTCKGKDCVGTQVVCNDKNPCTKDSCNKLTGCQFLNKSAGSCEDGNSCTTDSKCVNGVCLGTPKLCKDNNPCTDAGCETDKGCVFVPNNHACSDGQICTVGDFCQAGSCQAGPLGACFDNNPCTKDLCTTDDGCKYVGVSDGTSCDDGNPCTSGEQCQSAKCAAPKGGVTDCDDKNPCTDDTCSVTAGCAHTKKNNGASCKDGKPCTAKAACTDGTCQKTQGVDCDDGDACTSNACVLGKGCVATPFKEGSVCAKGDATSCTTAGVCKSGVCEGATARPWSQSETGAMRSCRSLLAHAVSGYLITGRKHNGSNWEAAWARVAFNGAPIWERTLASKKDAQLLGASADGGSALSAVGRTWEDSVGGSEGLFVRLSDAGQLVNKRVFSGLKDDALWGIDSASDGGHVLVGVTSSKGEPGSNGWIIRLDKDDKTVFDKTYGSVIDDALYDVALLADGSVFAVGDVGLYAGWALRVDAKGALVKQVYDGSTKNNAQRYRRVRRVSDAELYVAGLNSLRTYKADLSYSTSAPKLNGEVHDFIARPKGGYARAYGSQVALLSDKTQAVFVAAGNPGGGLRTLLAPDADSLLVLGENHCGLVRTDAFGNATCADSGACRDKPFAECVDDSLCTQGDTCKAGKCTANSTVTCDDKKVCTTDACDPKTGKCVFTPAPEGAACNTSTSLCAIAGKCSAGLCYGASVGAWALTYLPFYGCCGDTNNKSNEYQGARATAVAPRTDGAIFLAGPGYNRKNPNSVYGRLFYGTGSGGPRYSWYDRKANNNDSYADDHQVLGAVSFDNLTSCALTRYRYNIAKGNNKYSTTYKTVLMPNASHQHHLVLGDQDTVPVAMEPLGDDQRAVSLARHKVSGKWTFTLWVTRHAKVGAQVGGVLKPSLEQTWTTQFGDNDAPVGVAPVGDGGVVVGGTTKVSNVQQTVLARLDQAGKVAWKQLWVGDDSAAPYGVGWTGGGAVLTGQKKTTVSGTTSYFVWLRRHDSAGALVWDRKVLGDAKSDTHGFAVLPRAKGFALGARASGQNALLRISEAGHVIGDRRFGNTINDWKGLKTGFVGVGYKQTGSSWQNKWKQSVYIVRTDAFGNTACTAQCKGKAFADCDDNNPCTTDTCDTAAGCKHEALADKLDCADDGKLCTQDHCVAGKCAHPSAADGKACESDGDTCSADLCKSGACTHPALADGIACEDGEPCTEKDTCKSGTCAAGTQLAQYAACSDGTQCTKNGKCGADGTCQLKPVCSDGKPCTLDICAADGTCSFAAMKAGDACDDGNYCTEGTTCDAGGSCQGGKGICKETVALDVPMGCTTTTGWKFTNWEADAKWAVDATPNTVKPVTGTCTLNFNNGALYDGRGQAESPKQHPQERFGRLELRFWSRFETDVASEATQELRRVDVYRGYSRRIRYDNKSDVDVGKWHQLVFDLTSWRNATKNGNYLRFFFDDDGDLDRGKGWFIDDLQYVHQTHPDGEPCAFDNTCNDGDQCTADLCAKGHCTNKLAVGLACSDGDACTTDDACTAQGTCVAAKSVVCDDNDVCTANSCSKSSGCVFPASNSGGTCDDGDACTTSSACSGGSCYAKVSCDDHNPCTADLCQGTTCSHTALADGTFCGGSSVCTAGVCKAQASGWATAIAGHQLMCALHADGKRSCWALNGAGMIGDGVEAYRPAAPSLSLNTPTFTQLSVGYAYSCGLATTDGETHAWCMGSNNQLQCGATGTSKLTTWHQVAGSEGAVQVEASGYNTCVLRYDGTVRCWGYGNYGVLTGAKADNSASPVPVPGLSGVRQLASAAAGMLALHTDGTVSAWGASAYGVLANGSTSSGVLQKPTKISGLTGVRSLAGGKTSACAVKLDGTVRCWGGNTYGNLGDGTKTTRLTPVQVQGLTGAVSVGLGERQSCAVLGNGTVRCWGYNAHGQLGDGTKTERLKPQTTVSGLSGVVQLARNFIAPCALKSDGSVYCWGYGADTGDGSSAHALTPVLVKGSK